MAKVEKNEWIAGEEKKKMGQVRRENGIRKNDTSDISATDEIPECLGEKIPDRDPSVRIYETPITCEKRNMDQRSPDQIEGNTLKKRPPITQSGMKETNKMMSNLRNVH